MNRLYQIKNIRDDAEGFIHPVSELCKDSDELMHVFLMSKPDKYICLIEKVLNN